MQESFFIGLIGGFLIGAVLILFAFVYGRRLAAKRRAAHKKHQEATSKRMT